MKATKNPGLSVWAVLAVLFAGGIVTAYMTDNPSGKGQRNGKGGMTIPCGLRGDSFGNMTRMGGFAKANRSELGLSENATAEEIRTAMEEKMNKTRETIQAALDAGDYDTWKTAVESNPGTSGLAGKITEDNFSKYVEMQNYLAKARTRAQELGIENEGIYMGHGRGSGKFQERGLNGEERGQVSE